MTATERMDYAMDTVHKARAAAASGDARKACRLYRSAENEMVDAAAIDSREEVCRMAVICAASWSEERQALREG